MGNCETCENVDRKSSTNVVLKENLIPEPDFSPKFYELP